MEEGVYFGGGRLFGEDNRPKMHAHLARIGLEPALVPVGVRIARLAGAEGVRGCPIPSSIVV